MPAIRTHMTIGAWRRRNVNMPLPEEFLKRGNRPVIALCFRFFGSFRFFVRVGQLKRPCNRLDFVRFQDVTVFQVVESFQFDTAFVAVPDFFHVILEPLQ